MATQQTSSADSRLVHEVTAQVARGVVGQDYMVERLLISLLTGGHVLPTRDYELGSPLPQFEVGGSLYPVYVRGQAYLSFDNIIVARISNVEVPRGIDDDLLRNR